MGSCKWFSNTISSYWTMQSFLDIGLVLAVVATTGNNKKMPKKQKNAFEKLVETKLISLWKKFSIVMGFWLCWRLEVALELIPRGGEISWDILGILMWLLPYITDTLFFIFSLLVLIPMIPLTIATLVLLQFNIIRDIDGYWERKAAKAQRKAMQEAQAREMRFLEITKQGVINNNFIWSTS